MGFLRFRRTFKIVPGLRLNLSKSGVSTSVGRRGAWFTLGPRGTRATVGVPGTGLSYTEQSRRHHVGVGLLVLLILAVIVIAAIGSA
jgi:Protein of unknown function (DUF4236)